MSLPMILYKTTRGALVEHDAACYTVPGDWDDLFARRDPGRFLRNFVEDSPPSAHRSVARHLVAPIGSQEVWGAGVTYNRSRVARMSESKRTGGSDFYDRVYRAVRPELFFKASAPRVVGPGGVMHLRRDSTWIVPEPELTLAITAGGQVFGYTIGNDLSCRDIEGENPLYLPQAKTYAGCAALGPGILVTRRPLPRATSIALDIRRRGRSIFTGTTSISEIRKPFAVLVEHLYRDNVFPDGCFLMTGTGIVPPGRFSLRLGDEVRITIEHIGTLVNRMG
jgi:2-dehydro-3-deoxy-D-arabinonate dehydratase